MASSGGDVLPVGETLSETKEKLKKGILWGETPPEYAFVRGGWKSVEGVVEGCTPRNVKNKMLGYVFGE